MASWTSFRQKFTHSFSTEGLKTLCFDLRIDYDSLPGDGKEAKSRELLSKLERDGRFPELIDELGRRKPHIHWKQLVPDESSQINKLRNSGEVKASEISKIEPLPIGFLRGTISVETAGGVSTPLLIKNTKLPAQFTQIFSTATDNQSQVEVFLVFGENKWAKDNNPIGRYVLDKIPPAPKGIPQIEVSIEVDATLQVSTIVKNWKSPKEQLIGSADLRAIPIPSIQEPIDINNVFHSNSKTGYEVLFFPQQEDILEEFFEKSQNSLSDFYQNIFGQLTPKQVPDQAIKTVNCNITLKEAYNGTTKTFQTIGRAFTAKIPPGVKTGTKIRFNGAGGVDENGNAVDLFIETKIIDHPLFTREGDDLYIQIPITIKFANTGGKLAIPALDNNPFPLLKVPTGTSNKQTFRLQNKGFPSLRDTNRRGTLFVTVELYDPDNISSNIQEQLRLITKALKGRKLEHSDPPNKLI